MVKSVSAAGMVIYLLLATLMTVAAARSHKCSCDLNNHAIICKHLHITDLPEIDLFCGQYSWKIDLSHNMLIAFPDDLRQFKIVDLSRNSLETLEATFVQKVEELDVSENTITYIDLADAFPSLRQLDAPRNRLGMSSDEFLIGQCNLVYLDVSNNKITSLNSVTKCAQLSVLLAPDNDISKLPENFSRLTQLEMLDLSRNNLRYVFGLPTSLETLDLTLNKLKSIEHSTFKGLSSLRVLQLRLNQISSIAKDSFASLTSLERLSLSANRLKRLNGETFRGLKSLIQLQIKRNDIVYISEDAFSDLYALDSLNLEESLLTSLPSLRLNGRVRFISFKFGFIQTMNMSALMTIFSGSEDYRSVFLNANLLRGDDPEWQKIMRIFRYECAPEFQFENIFDGKWKGNVAPRYWNHEQAKTHCPCVKFCDKNDESMAFAACVSDAGEIDGIPWMIAAEISSVLDDNDKDIHMTFDDEDYSFSRHEDL